MHRYLKAASPPLLIALIGLAPAANMAAAGAPRVPNAIMSHNIWLELPDPNAPGHRLDPFWIPTVCDEKEESPMIDAGAGDCGEDDRKRSQINQPEADRMERFLGDAEELCLTVPAAQRIDCIAERYEKLARLLPSEGDNRAVRDALLDAAGKLKDIVRENRDTSVRTVRARTTTSAGRNRASSRPLLAIQPGAIEAAEAAAAAVIDELSTALLRSAGNSMRRQVYFAQIAEAVDSNKVLLRSA